MDRPRGIHNAIHRTVVLPATRLFNVGPWQKTRSVPHWRPVGAVLGGPFAAARFEVLARPVRRSCRLPPIGPQIMRRPASGLAQAFLVGSHEAAIETCSVRNALRTGQQRCGSAFLRQHAILKGSKHFRSQKLMAFWSLQNYDTLRSQAKCICTS